MKERLLSVGIDLGTSTTQLVFSRLTVENRAGPFAVPRMAITDREVIYRSAIHFTPLLDRETIHAQGVRDIVAAEYERAGIDRSRVETGAVIITGETARKENAAQVLAALSEFAGDFVVATAGPDLESVLAARGAGADVLSKEKNAAVLNFDVGGGTSNLALYDCGERKEVTCLDIGGRLVKYGETITYVAPVLRGRFPGLSEGEPPRREVLEQAAEEMAGVLAQAAGLRPPDGGLERYATAGAAPPKVFTPDFVTFSGGVADCLWEPERPWDAYGDLGVLLGQAIGKAFPKERLLRGAETIRATVVGAGSHSTELSGSTVFHRQVDFPLKNIPVLRLERGEEELPREQLAPLLAKRMEDYGESGAAVAMEGLSTPTYGQVEELALGLSAGLEKERGKPCVILLERDMAKVLGQAMSRSLSGPLLCLDGVAAGQGDYIDIGSPIAGGTVLPVVVKTLAFEGGGVS